MNRTALWIVSILVTYLVCVGSGVNRWMFIWLKRFYPSFALVFWIGASALLLLTLNRTQKTLVRTLMEGFIGGYIAGIIAYVVGPMVTDGSWTRVGSSIDAYGIASYLAMSMAYPALLLTWVIGITAVLLRRMLEGRSRADVYGGLATALVLTIGGWSFFLFRGVIPPKW